MFRVVYENPLYFVALVQKANRRYGGAYESIGVETLVVKRVE